MNQNKKDLQAIKEAKNNKEVKELMRKANIHRSVGRLDEMIAAYDEACAVYTKALLESEE